jgi:hypothetical protein
MGNNSSAFCLGTTDICMLCVAHALHRVCETICVLYPNVEKLVSNRKEIFVKLPVTVQLYENNTPDTTSNYILGNLAE